MDLLAVRVNDKQMKLLNEIPAMEETQAVSNGINTMKSELVRGKIIQSNRQPLNLRQKKNNKKQKPRKVKPLV